MESISPIHNDLHIFLQFWRPLLGNKIYVLNYQVFLTHIWTTHRSHWRWPTYRFRTSINFHRLNVIITGVRAFICKSFIHGFSPGGQVLTLADGIAENNQVSSTNQLSADGCQHIRNRRRHSRRRRHPLNGTLKNTFMRRKRCRPPCSSASVLDICASNDANVIEVYYIREGIPLHPRKIDFQLV